MQYYGENKQVRQYDGAFRMWCIVIAASTCYSGNLQVPDLVSEKLTTHYLRALSNKNSFHNIQESVSFWNPY
jgi:hypothetical protein